MDVARTGRLIAQVRKEKGLTQRQLAEALHVSDRAVSKWERGQNLPEAGLFEPLCAQLGITVIELLRGERAETALPALEQAVDAAVDLAAASERKQKRARWAAAAFLLALVLIFTVPLLREQARHRRLDQGQPPAPRLSFAPAPYTTLERELLACGRNDIPGPDGEPMVQRPAIALPQGVREGEHFIPMLELGTSNAVRFRLAYGMSGMAVTVLRWRWEDKGTGLGLEDGEEVPFSTLWDTADSGPYRGRSCAIDGLEAGWLYAIVICWGDGSWIEYPFRTV